MPPCLSHVCMCVCVYWGIKCKSSCLSFCWSYLLSPDYILDIFPTILHEPTRALLPFPLKCSVSQHSLRPSASLGICQNGEHLSPTLDILSQKLGVRPVIMSNKPSGNAHAYCSPRPAIHARCLILTWGKFAVQKVLGPRSLWGVCSLLHCEVDDFTPGSLGNVSTKEVWRMATWGKEKQRQMIYPLGILVWLYANVRSHKTSQWCTGNICFPCWVV